MLFRIVLVGGLTLMMGQHTRSESLFYYFRLDDQVPENHRLRLVDKHIDFGFARDRLEDSYSETGRPSIDPELRLRILLIGYPYGISSERKLVEELRMHLAWRWFTGLGFDQEVPHHSTFSKNRHGRFQESKVFEQLFEEVVARCLTVGLVRETSYRSMELSSRQTLGRRAASRESSRPKPRRSTEWCVSTWLSLKCKIQSRSRPIARTRCPPPIRTPRMQQKAVRRRVWGIPTTTWLITTAVSLWACKREVLG
jgi:transposase